MYDGLTLEQRHTMKQDEMAKAEKRNTIKYIKWLKAVNAGTEADMAAANIAQAVQLPRDSRGTHKRDASREAKQWAKIAKTPPPPPPPPFRGESLEDPQRIVRECKAYFRPLKKDIYSPNHARDCIDVASGWVKGDSLEDLDREIDERHLRGEAPMGTWEDFIYFLKGTVKDPLNRELDAIGNSSVSRGRAKGYDSTSMSWRQPTEKPKQPSCLKKREVYRFLLGLNEDLQAKIMGEGPDSRSTRDKVLNAAIRQEVILEAASRGSEESGSKGSQSTQPPSTKSKPTTSNSDTSTVAVGCVDLSLPTSAAIYKGCVESREEAIVSTKISYFQRLGHFFTCRTDRGELRANQWARVHVGGGLDDLDGRGMLGARDESVSGGADGGLDHGEGGGEKGKHVLKANPLPCCTSLV